MIILETELPDIRKRHERQVVVLAVGTFDLLHRGHMDYLEECKRRGDIVVVALANDDEVRARKGPGRPVIAEDERARIIDGCKATDYTVVRTVSSDLGGSMMHTARVLQPDVIVFGPDVPADVLQLFRGSLPGSKVVVDTHQKVNSTTDVIRRIGWSYGAQKHTA